MTGASEKPDEMRPEEAGIEELLRQVGPRDEPADAVMQEVRAAVRAQWRSMLEQRRKQRRLVASGVAASLIFGVAVATFGVRFITPDRVSVATLTRLDGRLIAAADDGQAHSLAMSQSITLGDTIRTDESSRAALAVKDLSVRLDRDTTVTIAAADRFVLDSGALYVDSPVRNATALTLQTDAGSVRHVGTQYQVRTRPEGIEVAVREGRVIITNAAGTSTGDPGEKINVSRRGAVTRGTLRADAPEWHWVASAAPPFDIDDQPLTAFLAWVGRETGRKIVYASAQAQAAAAQVTLRGSIAGLDPNTALTAVLSTTQLRPYRTREESIGIDFAAAIEADRTSRQTP